MKPAIFFVSVIFLCSVYTEAADCPSNAPWKKHNNICILVDDTPFTYANAQAYCQAKDPKATLVMVKDPSMQELLTSETTKIPNQLWLGAQHDDAKKEFIWEDGEPLGMCTYWAPTYPKMIQASGDCLILTTPLTREEGNWEHNKCDQQYAVICQLILSFDDDEATQAILKLQSQLAAVTSGMNQNFGNINNELTSIKSDTNDLKVQVVPVGSIHIEYHQQTSPPQLWPLFKFDEVTSLYAGLFFRAWNGDDKAWHNIEDDCAPRIMEMHYQHPTPQQRNMIEIPKNGLSEFGVAGYHSNSSGTEIREGLRFRTTDCEVRPKNRAIKIWKRIK